MSVAAEGGVLWPSSLRLVLDVHHAGAVDHHVGVEGLAVGHPGHAKMIHAHSHRDVQPMGARR